MLSSRLCAPLSATEDNLRTWLTERFLGVEGVAGVRGVAGHESASATSVDVHEYWVV